MIPLETKIMSSEQKIQDWYRHWNGKVYVSFSGGKDSTILLNIARSLYPGVPAVFCDTGLEYPEIKDFVRNTDNVLWIKPEMRFDKVIETYGYPLISKETSQKLRKLRTQNLSPRYRTKLLHGDERGTSGKLANKWQFLIDAPFKISDQCCDIMKKRPFKKFEHETGLKPIIGVMAYESDLRMQSWKRYGCNGFEMSRPQSRPLMPWTEDDVYEYISEFNLKISDIYSKGYTRTGCMFCGFGMHLEKKNRFDIMKETHPKQYDYIMHKLNFQHVLDYINDKGNTEQLTFNNM